MAGRRAAGATPPLGDAWQQGSEADVTEIDHCYCPNCGGGNGVSRVLPTKVPGFREILIISLTCEDCHFRNSEVTFGGAIQKWGERLALTVQSRHDLDRQILKSDSATVLLPNLSDLEIPPTTQQGVLTTIEGILLGVRDNLSRSQPDRLKLGDVDNFRRCQSVLEKIQRIVGMHHAEESDDDEDDVPTFPFQLVLDDPAGNSYIENLHAPRPDGQIKIALYDRTPSQDMALGLQLSQEARREGSIQNTSPPHKNIENKSSSSRSLLPARLSNHSAQLDHDPGGGLGRREVLEFPTSCANCHKSATTGMSVIDIPHFKEIVLMSLVCEHCGFRSSEIKGGGAIPRFGSRITLSVSSPADLDREVLKSDTAGIEIPEIELRLQEGGLNGVYTTVEGLLVKMKECLESANPFGSGDSANKQHRSNDGHEFSAPDSRHAKFMAFLRNLEEMAEGRKLPFTLIIVDPLANSFVGPIREDAIALSLKAGQDGNKDCYDSYIDPGIKIEEVERSDEQNETLGLNDIKTEGYNNVDL